MASSANELDSNPNNMSNRVEDKPKYSDNIVMNTIKIFDVAPQAAPVSAQPPAVPARNPPHAVPAVGEGAASDAIRQHAERKAETEAAEAAEAERKRSAAKEESRPHSFDREVGRVGDTFQVFVDLVSSSLKSHRFRIFGPPDNPVPPPPVPTGDPASAHAAYAGGSAKPPALKTDA